MIGRYILCAVFVIWGIVLGQIAGGLAGWFIDEVMGAGDIWRRVSIFCSGLFGAVIAFGNWRLRYERVNDTVHGSAQFASDKRVRQTLRRDRGLIVGRENRRGGGLLRHDAPGHLLTIAPTRSGKGVGAIIPNLLACDRSVFCLDAKGENTCVTYERRRQLGPVHVLDPFGVTGMPQAATIRWTCWIRRTRTWRRTPPCSPTPWSTIRRPTSAKRIGTKRPRR